MLWKDRSFGLQCSTSGASVHCLIWEIISLYGEKTSPSECNYSRGLSMDFRSTEASPWQGFREDGVFFPGPGNLSFQNLGHHVPGPHTATQRRTCVSSFVCPGLNSTAWGKAHSCVLTWPSPSAPLRSAQHRALLRHVSLPSTWWKWL